MYFFCFCCGSNESNAELGTCKVLKRCPWIEYICDLGIATVSSPLMQGWKLTTGISCIADTLINIKWPQQLEKSKALCQKFGKLSMWVNFLLPSLFGGREDTALSPQAESQPIHHSARPLQTRCLPGSSLKWVQARSLPGNVNSSYLPGPISEKSHWQQGFNLPSIALSQINKL